MPRRPVRRDCSSSRNAHSRGRSSSRSRSGGSAQREDAQPVVEVLAEAPLARSPAAGPRAWRPGSARPPARCGRCPPARSVLSCSTRSSLACSSSGSSPISSRSSVPPLAIWKRPARSRLAPVKAPFTWPNSSLSSSPAGMAAQLMVTKGWSARGLQRWMARASRSLPVPVSPRMQHRRVRLRHLPRPPRQLAHRRAPARLQDALRVAAPAAARAAWRARGPAGAAARGRPAAPRSGAPWPASARTPRPAPPPPAGRSRTRRGPASARRSVRSPAHSGTTMQECPAGRSSTPSNGSPSPCAWSSSVKARARRVSSASRTLGKSASFSTCRAPSRWPAARAPPAPPAARPRRTKTVARSKRAIRASQSSPRRSSSVDGLLACSPARRARSGPASGRQVGLAMRRRRHDHEYQCRHRNIGASHFGTHRQRRVQGLVCNLLKSSADFRGTVACSSGTWQNPVGPVPRQAPNRKESTHADRWRQVSRLLRCKAVVSLEKGKEFQDDHRTTSYPGKWQVLFFWPMDFTFVCPTEIAEFGTPQRATSRTATRRCSALSTDTHFVHLAWRKDHPDLKDLPFPMLADTKRELSQRARHPAQAGRRGAARDVHRRPRGHHPLDVSVNDLSVGRNVDEVLRVLDALQTDELCPCNWKKGETHRCEAGRDASMALEAVRQRRCRTPPRTSGSTCSPCSRTASLTPAQRWGVAVGLRHRRAQRARCARRWSPTRRGAGRTRAVVDDARAAAVADGDEQRLLPLPPHGREAGLLDRSRRGCA